MVAVLMLLPAFAVPTFANEAVVIADETTASVETSEETTSEESTESDETTEEIVTDELPPAPVTTDGWDTAHTTPFPDSEEESVTEEPESAPETDPAPEISQEGDLTVTESAPETAETTSSANQETVTTVSDDGNETSETTATEAPSLELTVTDDVPEGGRPMLGETITYKVAVVRNERGFCYGTFCFRPSDNLSYESATFMGEDVKAELINNAELAAYGSYGIAVGSTENYTHLGEYFTITFRVVNVGEATVEFFPFDVVAKPDIFTPVTFEVNNGEITHTVATPDKPVIGNETLPDGVADVEYTAVLEADVKENLTWEIMGGKLPAGLTLMSDGTVSGVPTEVGTFAFSVKAVLLGVVESDVKELELTILEKPRTLELKDDATYAISEENRLTGVTAKTGLSVLKSVFQNADDIKVYNADGEEITDAEAYIGTGCTVSLEIGGEKVHTVTVVVKGDTDGDGEIGTNDCVRIRAHFLEKVMLDGVYLEAARVSGEEEIGTNDFVQVRAHVLEKKDLYA